MHKKNPAKKTIKQTTNMLFFVLLTYISVYMAMAFAALCLATGLYYVAELAEEYSVLTKKILEYTVFVVVGAHVFLWVFDRFPLKYVIAGIISHVVYYQLLRAFPFISLKSISFVISCVCFLVSHYTWYRYFTDPWTPAFDFYQLLGFFFTCVWLVPGALFITLNIGENSLPGLVSQPSSDSRRDILSGSRKQNVVTWIHNWLMSFLPSSKIRKQTQLPSHIDGMSAQQSESSFYINGFGGMNRGISSGLLSNESSKIL